MPPRTFVPFSLKPKESSSIYSGFRTGANFRLGANFVSIHAHVFEKMERTLHVPKEVVAAILLVESHFGRNTGREVVLYRLSRVATVGAPDNLAKNLERLRALDRDVTLEDLQQRAAYLERTFLPEIPALIEVSKRNGVDIFDIKGSSAGAFGQPQFLPTAFLRYGYDGDGDGKVSLYDDVDAIWSAGNYLATFGYREDLPLAEKRSIIWQYNKSDAYIDTILGVARGIHRELER